MGQTPGDRKEQPSLELPSIPVLGRRKKSKKEQRAARAASPAPASERQEEAYVDEPTEPLYDAPAQTYDEPTEALPDDQDARRRAEPKRSGRTTPLVPGRLAALLTGLLVGAAGAAGTYGAMEGCEAVRGVSTCGGAPGFFVLVAILVLMVLLGAGLLRLFKVADPVSTSFLAVGVVAVVAMLVLLDVILSVWMFAVIPVLSALAFLLAHWVTTRFDNDATGRRDWT